MLRAAHFITTATEEFRENPLKEFSFLDPARVIAIRNGYDRDDLPDTLSEPDASGNFTLAPEGTLGRLVDEHALGRRILPRDGIAQYPIESLRAFEEGKWVTTMSAKGIERYDRRVQAGEFAHVLREANRLASR